MARRIALTEDHVARATRAVEKRPYPSRLTPCTDADYDRFTRHIMDNRPAGPLMIFAYGSLIWKPTFEATARHRATAIGWHRQFCMEMRGFRATPDEPGLMMTLVSGGRCAGVALEVAERKVDETVDGLMRRELPNVENLVDCRWITLATEAGPRHALVFWAGPTGPSIQRGLPLDQAARRIARACGWAGSNAEYLRNTVISLDDHGIRDRNLWRLQELVAAEIDRAFPPAPA